MENTDFSLSWVDVLLTRAGQHHSQKAFHFLPNGIPDSKVKQIDYASLAHRAKAIGAVLADQGMSGTRVPVIYPAGLEFIEAFLGVMFAGAVPVPVRAPGFGNASEFLLRTEKILTGLDTRFIVTDQQTASVLEGGLSREVRCFDATTVADSAAERWHHPGTAADDLAFIQYTSGSTRDPKGVCISHRNLIANCEAFTTAGFYEAGGVHVGWMPHYHDMGLVGSILGAIYGGVTAVLMPPQSFLRDPMRWLRAISHYRASSSGGPNFAYKLAAKRAASTNTEDLDLSCWAAAYCGAEPIQADVLTVFADTFVPVGFSDSAFLPCYGMAEATLFITGRKGLKLTESAPTAPNDAIAVLPRGPLVSLGKPFDSTEIRIVNTMGKQLPEGQLGEILIEGPGITKGYFGEPESLSSFQSDIGPAAGYFKTGDLGFLEDGELYVCGRSKDTIIVRGQNLYPQDIEQIAETVLGDLASSSTAAFALQTTRSGSHEEGFAVLVGVRKSNKGESVYTEILERIREQIIERLEVAPNVVALVPAREIPKTSSGKIQRSACARSWRAGEFTVLHQLGDQQPDSQHAIYPLLRQALSKYENRNTKYQFDLEKDIDWHRINQPGRYFSDDLLKTARVNPEVIKAHPEALEYYEWAYALLKAEQFIALERAVIEWGGSAIGEDVRSRSIALLEEEEAKHVALFQRYSQALTAMRPRDADQVLVLQRTHQEVMLGELLNPDNYESERHYHFSVWLAVLYFEEYTIWMDHMLPDDDPAYQPAWLQAHYCHRREEAQHVITDHCYIKGMDTTYDERARWSKMQLTRIFEATTAEFEGLIRITEDRFPELRGKIRFDMNGNIADLTRLLGHRAFSRTRDSAPYAEFVAGIKREGSPTAGGLPEHAEMRTWLRLSLSLLTDVPVEEIVDDASFANQGLDSLGHISLVAEIDNRYGIDIGLEAPYRYKTIDTFLAHLYTGTDHQGDRRSSFTTLNPGSNKTPLFWIYGAQFIPALMERLPDDRPLNVFHHMGADGSPIKYRSIAELAEYYVNAITDACKGRTDSVYLAGFSTGGLVAYEVARRLGQTNLQVKRLLLVSPATPPSLIAESQGDRSGASYWRYRLGRIMRLTPAQVLLRLQNRVKILQAIRHYRKNQRLTPALLPRYLMPLYDKAIRTHHIANYEGETLLIGEQGFPVNAWLSILKGKNRTLPLLPCAHEGFTNAEIASKWVPELIAELD